MDRGGEAIPDGLGKAGRRRGDSAHPRQRLKRHGLLPGGARVAQQFRMVIENRARSGQARQPCVSCPTCSTVAELKQGNQSLGAVHGSLVQHQTIYSARRIPPIIGPAAG